MTKNRTMRASILVLALVLITSCFVGGTLAKYISEAKGDDSARVAKWGVELSVTGDDNTFVTEYTGTDDKITVQSQTTEDLVAPGTKNDTGVIFKIDGKPEVATKVEISLGDEVKDVFLMYDGDSDGVKDEIYNPVVFTLTHTYGKDAWSIAPAATAAGLTCNTVSTTDTATTEEIKGTLAQIEAVLDNLSNSMTQVNPGYTYDDTFTLTWAWNFDGDDTLDTILGNLAANVNPDSLVEGVDYCLEVAYDFSITVVQVD